MRTPLHSRFFVIAIQSAVFVGHLQSASINGEDVSSRLKRGGTAPVFNPPVYYFQTPNCTFTAPFGKVSAASPTTGTRGLVYYTDSPYVNVDSQSGYISPLYDMNYSNFVIVVTAQNAYGTASAPVSIRSTCPNFWNPTTTPSQPYINTSPYNGLGPYQYGYNTGSSVLVYNSASNSNNINGMTSVSGPLCTGSYTCVNGQCSYSMGSNNALCSGIGNSNTNVVNSNSMYSNVGAQPAMGTIGRQYFNYAYGMRSNERY
ncbi:uncharacterized protein LOC129602776 [Paramacrobiotus metropolitanus]|uniref:uncharacterized protein LOC129602776 n=1 Tax=Paramacrobiotus metropolitanus TaxID=2943436 RepID=UPI002445AEE4|nr:uncharacterized protein LOC129602776 [Paramacrobiotus metropolitanus]